MLIANNCLHTSCPLCSSKDILKIGNIKYNKPLFYSSTSITITNTPQLWHCNTCRSGFVQNYISEKDSKKLYQRSNSSDRWSSTPFNKKHCVNTLIFLEKLFSEKQSATILDIGCNTGELLDFAKAKGCLTHGLEYSESAAKILEGKGHRAYNNFSKISNKFDIIFAFDLIEHVYDINVLLKECKRLLKANGKLVLLTGNIYSISARLAKENWWYVSHPEHIVFPSLKHLESLKFLSLKAVINTYASKGYEFSLVKRILGLGKLMIKSKTFNGLPALAPDHHLICLQNDGD